MQRIVLTKIESKDDDFLNSIIYRYKNKKKVWIKYKKLNEDKSFYPGCMLDGVILHSYPFSVKKFTYLVLSYLLYMWNFKDVKFIICTKDIMDFVFMNVIPNSRVFYNRVEWRSPQRMITKNMTYPVLRDLRLKFNTQPKIMKKIGSCGIFPYFDDKDMLDYWGEEKIIKSVNKILQLIKE